MYLHSKKNKKPKTILPVWEMLDANQSQVYVLHVCRIELNCFQLTVKAGVCGWGSKPFLTSNSYTSVLW